jgi:hypothetical protein
MTPGRRRRVPLAVATVVVEGTIATDAVVVEGTVGVREEAKEEKARQN